MQFMALFRGLRLFSVLGGLLAVGCGHLAHQQTRQGPTLPTPVEIEPWTYAGQPAKRVMTRHYTIYSTVMENDFLRLMGQVMEGALGEYRELAPAVPISDRPMECYIFANRPQWAEFTRQQTGRDSAVYLQINRGGYTVRDWYVSYFLGDIGTYSVAAHEGFHQFTARHFRKRVPPFLEEGLACLFEDVTWDGSLPRWDPATNNGRQAALRHGIEQGLVMPLDEVARLHAGQMIHKSVDEVGAYYAQSWGFARFCMDYDHGKYRAALQRMLSDAAAGTLQEPVVPPAGPLWNPAGAGPLLEHYFQADIKQLDREYQAYLRELIRD